MRITSKASRFAVLSVLLATAAVAGAQNRYNVVTQLNWVPSTSFGPPTLPCTSSNYGQPNTDLTNQIYYVCGIVAAVPAWVRVSGGQSGLVFTGPWNSSTTYTASPVAQAALYNNAWYVSLQNNNLNQTPGTATSYWALLFPISGGGITQMTKDVQAGPGTGAVPGTVVGLEGVPFCNGFSPSNGQLVQYTTGGSPNPCYSAATVAAGSTTLTGDVTGTGTGTVATTVAKINNVPLCAGFSPTNGQVLEYTTASSPNPCYTAATAGGSSPLSTKGDIYGYTTTNARVPVGPDGTVLRADSTQAAGVAYAPVSITQLGMLPFELYGVVGDSNGTTGNGTDNTTAMQNCLNALTGTFLNCVASAGKVYRVTSHLAVTGNNIGIVGTGGGPGPPLAAGTARGATIMIDSASENCVDVTGAWNTFRDFTCMRPVLPTGSATAIAFSSYPTGGAATAAAYVDNVSAYDNIYGFSWLGGASYGNAIVSNIQSINGANPNVTGYGSTNTWCFYLFSDSTRQFASLFLQNLTCADLTTDPNNVGLALVGSGSDSQINDVYVDGLQTNTQGTSIVVTSPSLDGVYDDHFRKLVLQSKNGISVTEQSSTDSNGELEFNDVWFASVPDGSGVPFSINTSQGVTIDHMMILEGVASSVTDSNRIALRSIDYTGYQIFGFTHPVNEVDISGTVGSIFADSMAKGTRFSTTPCLFCFTSGSTNNTIGNNVVYAPTSTSFGSLATFDSTSNNNEHCGNTISGPGTTGALYTDAGTGNQCTGAGAPNYSFPATVNATSGLTSASGSASCVSATCTSLRGTVQVVAGTFTTGGAFSVDWTTPTPTVMTCQVSQGGGTTYNGYGATAGGSTTSAGTYGPGVSIAGTTTYVQYLCQP